MADRSQMTWKRRYGFIAVAVSVAAVSQVGAAQHDQLYDSQLANATPRNTVSTSNQLAKVITINISELDVHTALKQIAAKAGIDLTYETSIIPGKSKISFKATNITAEQAIRKVCELAGVDVDIYATSGSRVNLKVKSSKSDQGANSGSVAGRVVDSASGQPILGVSVMVSGSKLGTTTDARGVFTLPNVTPGAATLTFKMIGYRVISQSVDVQAQKTSSVNVVLAPSATTLSGIVTTATGTQRRVEVPSDIVKIDGDRMRERAPIRSVVDMLEAAQVPGVLVTRASGDPGAPARIRMRGIGSISQSNDPVMIVDGVWVDMSMSSPSRLDDIDPASIETIEIVRGPSASTLYGQDASNGVIIITTKRGKAGPTRYNISYNRDWGQTYGTLPISYVGIGTAPRQTIASYCPIASVLSFACKQDSVITFDPNNKLLSKEGTATNETVTFQMDGGAPAVTYSLTLSTGKTTGVRRVAEIDRIRFGILEYMPESKFNRPSELTRNNFTANLSFNPRSNLSFGTTIGATQSNLKDNLYEYSWASSQRIVFGNVPRSYSVDTTVVTGDIRALEKPVVTTSGRLSGNIQYRPRERYVINGTFGAERTAQTESNYTRRTRCSTAQGCADTLGGRAERSENRNVYTVKLNASTNLNLGAIGRVLELNPSIGGDFKRTGRNFFAIIKDQVPVGDRSITQGVGSSSGMSLDNAIAGWFLNSTIGLFKRVYFDVGVRQDIGSAITSSNDAVYPKLGGSWLVSDENFWRENRFVNSLRLRSAIGHSAVQPGLGDLHGKFMNSMEYIEGKWVPAAEHISTGNNRLQPERAVELELGFDIDALGDRLNVIGTFARKENRNTLVTRPLPPSFGTPPFSGVRKENVARVQNQNFELSVNGRVVEANFMRVLLNMNMTMSDNKVASLGNNLTPSGLTETQIVPGYPLSALWTKKVLGYRDENDDGLLSPDEIILSDSLVYVGWSQPRFRIGYGLNVSINNQLVFDSRFSYQSQYAKNFGQPMRYGGEDVKAPLADQALFLINTFNDSRNVTDLRWTSASLTYHLPKSILRKMNGRSVSVALQGRNLGLWTNYVGKDPSINTTLLDPRINRSIISTAEGYADSGNAPPPPRSFVLDFKIGL